MDNIYKLHENISKKIKEIEQQVSNCSFCDGTGKYRSEKKKKDLKKEIENKPIAPEWKEYANRLLEQCYDNCKCVYHSKTEENLHELRQREKKLRKEIKDIPWVFRYKNPDLYDCVIKNNLKALWIYGKAGCGKTSSLLAMLGFYLYKGHKVLFLRDSPDKNIARYDFDQFDIVGIDDLGINMKYKKYKTQYFQLFDVMYRSNAQFILTSQDEPTEFVEQVSSTNKKEQDRYISRVVFMVRAEKAKHNTNFRMGVK